MTKKPFGSGNHTEMVLEATSRAAKNKWLYALKEGQDPSGGQRATEGTLICEGPLLKIAHSGSNKTRWFCLTDKNLAYFKEEGGELMASVHLEHILLICNNGWWVSYNSSTFQLFMQTCSIFVRAADKDEREIKVCSSQRFTVSGHSQLVLRGETGAIRNKYVLRSTLALN